MFQYESDKGINGAKNLILEFLIINGYTSCKHKALLGCARQGTNV